ncbi:MAG: phosphotransferase [Psychrobium sp.]|nr:phosphotransferase [Psychrobium sp.]
MIDNRRLQLTKWFCEKIGIADIELTVVSADASFRRYFRYQDLHTSYILVDAPSSTEKNPQFIAYASHYAAQGIDVPRVLFSDIERGFLCLTDLGDQTLLPLLKTQRHWYALAVKQLPLIAAVQPMSPIIYYDEAFFSQELALFKQWFCNNLLALDICAETEKQLEECMQWIITTVMHQPQVTVHRDFHARNIMVRDNKSLAIIDFQDTVVGPITYDAVSLLKDCYFKLPADQRQTLMEQSYQQFIASKIIDCPLDTYKMWFDIMGLQRHLKVCGIFSRLSLRDHKANYLNDLPLVVHYILDVCQEHESLAPLLALFELDIMPILSQRIEQCTR